MTDEKECPECGGEIILDEEYDETACVDCGFVVELDKEEEKLSARSLESTIEWSKNSEVRERSKSTFTDRESTDDEESREPPETVAEWEMWYPCPTCESTRLSQIIESHLAVSATEDGSYGGEQGGVEEYNYVECEDCGEVLLDEIGKNQ